MALILKRSGHEDISVVEMQAGDDAYLTYDEDTGDSVINVVQPRSAPSPAPAPKAKKAKADPPQVSTKPRRPKAKV